MVNFRNFKVAPFLLAGFCGYIHTVINQGVQMDGMMRSQHQEAASSMIDMPREESAAALLGHKQHQQQLLQSLQYAPHSRRLDIISDVNPSDSITIESDQGITDYELPPENLRVPTVSDEYQESLVQYTMALLPNHRDPSSKGGGGGESTSSVVSGAGGDADNNDDVLNPKPYAFHQVDIIVPASGQDDRLRLFAENLGVALKNFLSWYEDERRPAILRRLKQEEEDQVSPENNDEEDEDEEGNKSKEETEKAVSSKDVNLDLTFRFLITRYPQDKQKTDSEIQELQKELAQKANLSVDQIHLIRVGNDDDNEAPRDLKALWKKKKLRFNRAHARNVLHQNACHSEDCIVTAMDVDMQVLPSFFHTALRTPQPYTKAYFPIVFSEYNPWTVQLVQDYLYPPLSSDKKRKEKEAAHQLLPPFSEHRGLWRDFGYGMYVLAGVDAKRFQFNEQYQGWGHEDNDFYKLVHNNMRVHRQHEHGLIHGWHPKNCSPGKEIITPQQWIDCLNSRDVMEGSPLGMLLRPPLPDRSKEKFPVKKKSGSSVTAKGNKASDPQQEQQNQENVAAGDQQQQQQQKEEGEKEAPEESEQQQEETENDDSDTQAGEDSNQQGDSTEQHEDEKQAASKDQVDEEQEDEKEDEVGNPENKKDQVKYQSQTLASQGIPTNPERQ
jgi:hypothetical protein